MMKALKRELQSVVKNLNSLTQKTAKIAKKMEKLEKSTAAKKPKAKARAKAVKKVPSKKAKKITATDTVLTIISRRSKGTDCNTLKQRTGFKDIKIRNIIHRLKTQGKIKSKGRGIYVKA